MEASWGKMVVRNRGIGSLRPGTALVCVSKDATCWRGFAADGVFVRVEKLGAEVLLPAGWMLVSKLGPDALRPAGSMLVAKAGPPAPREPERAGWFERAICCWLTPPLLARDMSARASSLMPTAS